MADDPHILEQALAWANSGAQVAIATVIRTWGSSPRPAGSQLAISQAGAIAGSVSGGCVEAAVIAEAQDVMKSGQATQMTFGVTNERAWAVGLACGGEIIVRIEALA